MANPVLVGAGGGAGGGVGRGVGTGVDRKRWGDIAGRGAGCNTVGDIELQPLSINGHGMDLPIRHSPRLDARPRRSSFRRQNSPKVAGPVVRWEGDEETGEAAIRAELGPSPAAGILVSSGKGAAMASTCSHIDKASLQTHDSEGDLGRRRSSVGIGGGARSGEACGEGDTDSDNSDETYQRSGRPEKSSRRSNPDGIDWGASEADGRRVSLEVAIHAAQSVVADAEQRQQHAVRA